MRPGQNVSVACFAAPLHGTPAWQTGVVGPIVTDPQRTPVTSTASGMRAG